MDEPKRVIIDTDVGTDDAIAILFFLYAEKLKKVKIEAIVCTGGNATLDNVCKNVVRLLEVACRTDIPVYKGSQAQILPTNNEIFAGRHGSDGFGDLSHENEPDLSIIRKEHAAVALQEIVGNNPKQITLICLGPLTNVALAMRLYHDFAKNIKEICVMGGNYTVGNITGPTEFNFSYDPEAAHILFECAKCPILLLPWECCQNADITFEWRCKILGELRGTVWSLVDKADRNRYKDKDLKSYWAPCDSFLAAAYLFPEVISEQVGTHVSVEIHGRKTRGRVVIDHEENGDNVLIVCSVNGKVFKEILVKVCANI